MTDFQKFSHCEQASEAVCKSAQNKRHQSYQPGQVSTKLNTAHTHVSIAKSRHSPIRPCEHYLDNSARNILAPN